MLASPHNLNSDDSIRVLKLIERVHFLLSTDPLLKQKEVIEAIQFLREDFEKLKCDNHDLNKYQQLEEELYQWSFKFLKIQALGFAKLLYEKAKNLVNHHFDTPSDTWEKAYRIWFKEFITQRQDPLTANHQECIETEIREKMIELLNAKENDPTCLVGPSVISLLVRLGDTFPQVGKTIEEVSTILKLVEGLQYDPGDPNKYKYLSTYFKNFSWNLCKIGAFKEAIRCYTKGIELVKQSTDLMEESFASESDIVSYNRDIKITSDEKECEEAVKAAHDFQSSSQKKDLSLVLNIFLYKAKILRHFIEDKGWLAAPFYEKVIGLIDSSRKDILSILHLYTALAHCCHPATLFCDKDREVIKKINAESKLFLENVDFLKFNLHETTQYLSAPKFTTITPLDWRREVLQGELPDAIMQVSERLLLLSETILRDSGKPFSSDYDPKDAANDYANAKLLYEKALTFVHPKNKAEIAALHVRFARVLPDNLKDKLGIQIKLACDETWPLVFDPDRPDKYKHLINCIVNLNQKIKDSDQVFVLQLFNKGLRLVNPKDKGLIAALQVGAACYLMDHKSPNITEMSQELNDAKIAARDLQYNPKNPNAFAELYNQATRLMFLIDHSGFSPGMLTHFVSLARMKLQICTLRQKPLLHLQLAEKLMQYNQPDQVKAEVNLILESTEEREGYQYKELQYHDLNFLVDSLLRVARYIDNGNLHAEALKLFVEGIRLAKILDSHFQNSIYHEKSGVQKKLINEIVQKKQWDIIGGWLNSLKISIPDPSIVEKIMPSIANDKNGPLIKHLCLFESETLSSDAPPDTIKYWFDFVRICGHELVRDLKSICLSVNSNAGNFGTLSNDLRDLIALRALRMQDPDLINIGDPILIQALKKQKESLALLQPDWIEKTVTATILKVFPKPSSRETKEKFTELKQKLGLLLYQKIGNDFPSRTFRILLTNELIKCNTERQNDVWSLKQTLEIVGVAVDIASKREKELKAMFSGLVENAVEELWKKTAPFRVFISDAQLDTLKIKICNVYTQEFGYRILNEKESALLVEAIRDTFQSEQRSLYFSLVGSKIHGNPNTSYRSSVSFSEKTIINWLKLINDYKPKVITAESYPPYTCLLLFKCSEKEEQVRKKETLVNGRTVAIVPQAPKANRQK